MWNLHSVIPQQYPVQACVYGKSDTSSSSVVFIAKAAQGKGSRDKCVWSKWSVSHHLRNILLQLPGGTETAVRWLKKCDLSFRKSVLIREKSGFENHYSCGLMPAYMYTACGLSFDVRFYRLARGLLQTDLQPWLSSWSLGLVGCLLPRSKGSFFPRAGRGAAAAGGKSSESFWWLRWWR